MFAALVADHGHVGADVPERADAEGDLGTAVSVHRFPRADLPEYTSCTPPDFRPVLQNHLRAAAAGDLIDPNNFIADAGGVTIERL